MNCFMIYFLLICLTIKIKFIHLTDNYLDITNENRNQNIRSFKTSVVCNKTSLEVEFNFEEPFNGVIYSNQIFSKSASQCRSYGNGSKVIHFLTNSHECGVTQIDNQSNHSQYDLVLYVQNDRNIQQSSDEKLEVKCWPQDVLLRGVVANQTKQQTKISAKSLYGGTVIQVHQIRTDNISLSHVTDSLECRMDVMRGRIPFLKPIDGFVDLGQDVTLLIRIKEIDGIDSMVSRCYAHEGSHAVKQELTNSDGCSIDKHILPDFQLMPNPPSDFKVYFTTFPAFKFPDKTNLNIQCTLIICNTTCPQIQCDNTRGIGLSSRSSGSDGPNARLSLHRRQRNAKRAIIRERELTKRALTERAHNEYYSDWDSLMSQITQSSRLSLMPFTYYKPNNDYHNHKQVHKTIKSNLKPTHHIDIKQLDQLDRQCLTPQLLLALSAIIAMLCALSIACYCTGHHPKQLPVPHKTRQSNIFVDDFKKANNQVIPVEPLPNLTI